MVQVIEADGRYPLDAFRFLQEGLEHTVRRVHGEAALDQPVPAEAGPAKTDPRHVSGADLCRGLRELAVARWGRLGGVVLNAWHVYATRDFGEMVFILVDGGFSSENRRRHHRRLHRRLPAGRVGAKLHLEL